MQGGATVRDVLACMRADARARSLLNAQAEFGRPSQVHGMTG